MNWKEYLKEKYKKESVEIDVDESSGSSRVKAICTHCGKKQTATEKDYSLDDVACKFCKKEGELRQI